MTETRSWLNGASRSTRRLAWGASLGFAAAAFVATLVVGVLLAHGGAYRVVPLLALGVWAVAVAVVVVVLAAARRWRAPLTPSAIARRLEVRHAWRRGSVWALAEPSRSGSDELWAAADRSMLQQLVAEGASFLQVLRRRAAILVASSVLATAAMVVLLAAANPNVGAAADFWHPVSLALRANARIGVTADRTVVPYGDSVTLRVDAPGAVAADLWTRAPGETWQQTSLALDSVGRGAVTVGPLSADLFVRASSGDRESDTLHVEVSLPVFLVDLALTARFPAYLTRSPEPIALGVDTAWVPEGTIIETSGGLSAGRVATARWRSAAGDVALETDGPRFSGDFQPARTDTWELVVTPDDRVLDDVAPAVVIGVIEDQAPLVTIAVPVSDTTLPSSLRQPLVVDLADDYRLAAAEVRFTRRSRLGIEGASWQQRLDLGPDPGDRVVVSEMLDFNARELVPGDTVRLMVRAVDDAPTPHWGESRELVLRIPSLNELREELRREAEALSAAADSLSDRQADLTRDTEALAAERQRAADDAERGQTRQDDELGFRDVERAQAVADEQEAVMREAERLRDDVEALQDALESAGVNDAEWQEQLEAIRELLQQAMSPELAERLQDLRDALDRLDERQVRQALERLAEEQERLQQELERNRELLERAALEGQMATLAQDAEELAAEQERWTEQVEANPDSASAAREDVLAEEADSLAARLDALGERLAEEAGGEQREQAGEHADRAQQAAEQMRQAAQSARNQQGAQAEQQGQQASEMLSQLPQDIRQQGEQLAQQFQQEVLDAMDRSLVETAGLAKAQEDLARRMQRGDVGADARRQQAAVEEGVEQLLRQMQEASGKNALVSPEISSALARAQQQMSAARDLLERASPDGRQAGEMANQALDALNQAAYRLLRSRGNVASAQSGSGLAEAMEQMAELARQQGGMNQEAGDLLSMLPTGAPSLQQRLQELAAEQRQLGEDVQQAGEDAMPGAAEALAEEAREIAAQLEQGRLDPRLLERQEELFRRLLDAGRSLEGEEPESEEERRSETAEARPPRIPEADVTLGDRDARFRFPSWDQLKDLTPEQRRIVLDYFRRLNDASRRP